MNSISIVGYHPTMEGAVFFDLYTIGKKLHGVKYLKGESK